jgi:DNA recombination protein RmuC
LLRPFNEPTDNFEAEKGEVLRFLRFTQAIPCPYGLLLLNIEGGEIMDQSLVIAGFAINAVLLIVILLMFMRSRGSGEAGSFDSSLVGVRDELMRNINNVQSQLDQKFNNFRDSLEQNAKIQRDEAAQNRVEIQTSLRESIQHLQEGNEKKLEEMRVTVDEKLQGTLEKRLGESFKQVSDQLETVHKGLGEMKTLASDVGNLQRVLTNVKNRGGWGEVQLARQLEDMLSPEQYDSNVQTKKTSNDRVEFAVKMPGKTEAEFVYLPIDSKFPQEDYERLLSAQEAGDTGAVELASKGIESTIKAQAKLIHDKYIDVPHTTDFAIMYLPTEGLFAEVIRRPGLANKIQNEFRVQVTGPTTLMAFLNSLQMGFKTLAIEKSASDVWAVLSAAKTEFRKYGEVWDKLGKQLSTAQNTVAEAGKRSRAVERVLSKVETGVGIESATALFEIESGVEEEIEIDLEETE